MVSWSQRTGVIGYNELADDVCRSRVLFKSVLLLFRPASAPHLIPSQLYHTPLIMSCSYLTSSQTCRVPISLVSSQISCVASGVPLAWLSIAPVWLFQETNSITGGRYSYAHNVVLWRRRSGVL